jgi:hypothetical protein
MIDAEALPGMHRTPLEVKEQQEREVHYQREDDDRASVPNSTTFEFAKDLNDVQQRRVVLLGHCISSTGI